MQDVFPSITAEEINHAADLLGLRGDRLSDYPPHVKADRVQYIRFQVLALEIMAQPIPPEMAAEMDMADWHVEPVHPDLLAFVRRADADHQVDEAEQAKRGYFLTALFARARFQEAMGDPLHD